MSSTFVENSYRMEDIRRRVFDHVSGTGVIGSMIGLKIRNGRALNSIGITLFVREKIPKHELREDLLIPSTIYVGGTSVRTDVMIWPKMQEQRLPPGAILYDGKHQGTLTCFGISPFGEFGVSCAHCLSGIDDNPATPSTIAIFSKSRKMFLDVGKSVYSSFSPGQGREGNFGYLDCGLFDLHDDALGDRVRRATKISIVQINRSLIGDLVAANSTLEVPGFSDQRRTARIIGINSSAMGEFSDLILLADAPGTFTGDSGMLWRDQNGNAVAIHARGELKPSFQGSNLISAMSAERAASILNVAFMSPGT